MILEHEMEWLDHNERKRWVRVICVEVYEEFFVEEIFELGKVKNMDFDFE